MNERIENVTMVLNKREKRRYKKKKKKGGGKRLKMCRMTANSNEFQGTILVR